MTTEELTMYTAAILFFITWLAVLIFSIREIIKTPLPEKCEHKTTVKLSSIQKQICHDCGEYLPWPLKDGQQPLVSSNRDKRVK